MQFLLFSIATEPSWMLGGYEECWIFIVVFLMRDEVILFPGRVKIIDSASSEHTGNSVPISQ